MLKYILFLLLFSVRLAGQQDTTVLLTEDEFLRLVEAHHPLSVRADLQRERAQAVLLMARGGFDPKLYGDLDQKYFNGTRYYSTIEGGLKVPTWFGVELNAAYERNDGTFLNPELTVPESGLYAAGLSVALARGMLFDQRRAELRRAEIYQRATVAERQILLNQLLYDAGAAYWDWAGAQGVVDIYQEAVELARTRYVAVAASASLGDRPAIDTLEARILVQNRQLELEAALLERANAAAALAAYLWIDGVVPMELAPATMPPSTEVVEVAPIVPVSGPLLHPELTRTRLKIEELEVDERLQREQLKPQIDLKYNALLLGGTDQPLEDLSSQNYKWGVTFNQPLLLRKERGKLQLTRIKLSENQLALTDKAAALGVKITQAENEINVTVAQFNLAGQNAEDYRNLLEGERELFRAGESFLFLVNSRESSYINALIKRVELLVKHRKARLAREFARGLLGTAAGVVLPTD